VILRCVLPLTCARPPQYRPFQVPTGSEAACVITPISPRTGRLERKRRKISILGSAKSHHRSLAVHPTRFPALASLFPAVTHSRFVIRPEGAACRPWARLPLPSRVQLRHHKARVRQPENHTRCVAQAMWRPPPLPHRPLVAPPLQLYLPLRPCQALKMYARCQCPHAIQLSQVAANVPRQRRVQSPLHQWAVLRP
jgi:hypothetical protein